MWGQQQTEEYTVTRSQLQRDRVVERTEQSRPDLAIAMGHRIHRLSLQNSNSSTLLTALMLPMHMDQSLQGELAASFKGVAVWQQAKVSLEAAQKTFHLGMRGQSKKETSFCVP